MDVDPRLAALVPATRAFYAARTPGRGPDGPAGLRDLRARLAAPPPSQPPATVEVLQAGGRGVPARVHLPASPPVGVVLELHGGGFYAGSAAGSDVRNRRTADALGVAVLSVDYRLAPEHPWPAAPDDSETAARWLAEHAPERFGTDRLVLTGSSAGATLAMVTLLRLRDHGTAAERRGTSPFLGAVLEYGTYDLSGSTPAGRLIADEWFLDAYAGDSADRTHPDLSPAFADLAGLPPVLLVVGEDDVLLADQRAMAGRLVAAGVDADLRVYPASPHGFLGHDTPVAAVARDDVQSWVRERLSGYRPSPVRTW